MFSLGIDLGTQGVRAIVVDKTGNIIAAEGHAYDSGCLTVSQGCHEQSAYGWWDALQKVLKNLMQQMGQKGYRPEDITVLSVDGTSGTIAFLDENFDPVYNGIMYNDARSAPQAKLVREKGRHIEEKLGYSFGASFALPKMLWFKETMPDLYAKVRCIVHQSDFVVGRLTGRYDISDYSNALKSGYDLIDDHWPAFIQEDLGIDIGMLPKIVAPGAVIGKVSEEAAAITGLSPKTLVTAGATDGYASSISSGIAQPGDVNTTIGTTMVIKAISQEIIKDEKGRVYCHLHPQGYWMPGGASNVGGGCLNNRFDKNQFDVYNTYVEGLTPTGIVIYPLIGKGERFPFIHKEAEEFIIGDTSCDKKLYAALMEGVAYTERLAYDTLTELGCGEIQRVFVTGGTVKSREWTQIRANVLNKPLYVPEVFETAMGSAIIAASCTMFQDLKEASAHMVRIQEVVEPQPEKVAQYDVLYGQFCQQCRDKGYL